MLKSFRPLAYLAAAALLGATGLGLASRQTVKAQGSVGTPSILEFRWDGNKDFKKLYYYVSNTERTQWGEYFLVLRAKDRKAAILKLSITIPSYFNTNIDPKNVKLCYTTVGGYSKRTKCEETIPAEIQLTDNAKRIDIFPTTPVPPDKAIAVVFNVSNPVNGGMFQFNALAQAPGDIPMAGYLGSWVIEVTN
ncbi:MAG: DUF2808 domain-containing protein [Synechococcaceae bacterium WB9_3_282]|nr:DUF2808 domain-containing protein [Synechococcaceae bacterium WB8_3_299]NDD21842.1 DUF2808 domain-containing protein [Synechococcaceae bacterium WBA_3_309]NDE22763.1 DUF2808 domain-containing protein [Synechococcaceae bacterium WB9_3_282]